MALNPLLGWVVCISHCDTRLGAAIPLVHHKLEHSSLEESCRAAVACQECEQPNNTFRAFYCLTYIKYRESIVIIINRCWVCTVNIRFEVLRTQNAG